MKKILKSTLLLTITFACLALTASITEAKYNPHYGELTGWGNTRSGQTTISRNPDNAFLLLYINVSDPNGIDKHLAGSSARGVLSFSTSSPWSFIRSAVTPLGATGGRIAIHTAHEVRGGDIHKQDVEYLVFYEN